MNRFVPHIPAVIYNNPERQREFAIIRDFRRSDLNALNKGLAFLRRFNRMSLTTLFCNFGTIDHPTEPKMIRLVYRGDQAMAVGLAGYYAGQLSVKLRNNYAHAASGGLRRSA